MKVFDGLRGLTENDFAVVHQINEFVIRMDLDSEGRDWNSITVTFQESGSVGRVFSFF